MDPFSVTAGVVGILDSVTKLSCAIAQFRHDYKLADEDLDVARQHALLLKEEIRALELRKASNHAPPRKTAEEHHDPDCESETKILAIEDPPLEKAMSTAHELLSTIEASFPLRSEPHTWRSKVRWALKDKQVLARLKERLKSAESTLQGIAAMEQLRVSQVIYGMLLQQSSVLARIETAGISTSNVINMAAFNQSSPQSIPSVVKIQLSEIEPTAKPSTQMTKPTKPLLMAVRSNRWGFSARVVVLPKEKGASCRTAVHVSLLGKLYSVQIRMTYPDFSFDRMFHVRNMVPADSAMPIACRTGDFKGALELLTSGLAHGSDVTQGGWPMLDYAIESGSARLVSLLLEHGAPPNLEYGEHNMTALQSCFLRGRFDIARLLLAKGADLEHVDSDGYSVLSYLWVVDKPLDKSGDFMSLCLANDFSEVNSCDSRGWSAFHRAAAIGIPEDIEAFLRLGASLDLRADWYGWSALFFAASHDNVETFQTIVRYSGAGVYQSLDGDGWNLLHCCIYFGAPRVMNLVLENGIDVNQLSHPAPLPEDPELSYRELTPVDIALYIGPKRYQMFMDALAETKRDVDFGGNKDIFWDATSDELQDRSRQERRLPPIYGAEDVDDRWTVLHWASYNGSHKVRKLLLLKGADPKHLDAISLEEYPTILPTSPFEGR